MNARKKIGILGYGEIGSSLDALYKEKQIETIIKDKNDDVVFPLLNVLNVCIPYSDSFVDIIKQEVEQAKPNLTIIHSTVSIGTTTKLFNSLNEKYSIVHSPIRGNHPDLTRSLKTFVKYISSPSPKALSLAALHLRELGMSISTCNRFEKTEAAKLLCTTYYGLCIAWHNEIKKVCDLYEINVDFIKNWNDTYNKGYSALNLSKFSRPILDPPENNKIGGHCVIPNAELLDLIIDSKLIKEIITYK